MIRETNTILNLIDFRNFSDTFIETGTCFGEGVQRALDAGFKKVESVEFLPEFYEKSYERFKKNKNVKIYEGKSWERLPSMIGKYSKPLVIMLDAHPAGPGTGGHEDYIKYDRDSEFHQHNIIMNELDVILRHRNDHIIIIDDMNKLDEDNLQYLKMCSDANEFYEFFFYDEKIGKEFYHNKSIVCIPKVF